MSKETYQSKVNKVRRTTEARQSLNHLAFKISQRYRPFSLHIPLEMASLSNSRWQNRKERLNRSLNNEDMVHRRRYIVTLSVIE